jgi:TonB-dependent SusC/RagA subfamily outer membrane receptor
LVVFQSFVFTQGIVAQSLGKKITIELKNQSLHEALQQIESASGFKMSYTINQVKDYGNITVEKSVLTISQILDKVLVNTRLTYLLKNQNILIIEKENIDDPSLFSNKIIVSGKIVDAGGYTLIGVTIKVKGRNDGTISDIDGNYSLLVNKDDALLFSYIGYLSKEISVNAQEEINIVLNEDVLSLDEVVVVNNGYQSLPKERSAGSFSTPDLSILQQRSTSNNLLDRLDGLIPGLVFNNGTNNEYYPVMLRGLTSINASFQPLYVVDGIPVDNFNNVNPNDVENISVLKDASAAAIYGVKAANGIILIETKSGGVDKKA